MLAGFSNQSGSVCLIHLGSEDTVQYMLMLNRTLAASVVGGGKSGKA